MGLISSLAPLSVWIVGALASHDSFITAAYLSIARLITNTQKHDFFSKIAISKDKNESLILNFLPDSEGLYFAPMVYNLESQKPVSKNHFPSVSVFSHKELIVNVCSSYAYDKNQKTIYVDGSFIQTTEFADYAGGHLLAHGRNQAVIRLRIADHEIEKGIFLGGNGSYNYYHWLVEICSKIQVLEHLSGIEVDTPLLVNKCVAEYPAYREILDILTPRSPLIFLNEEQSYLVKNLVFIDPLVTAPFNLRLSNRFKAEHFICRPEAVHYLRNRVLSSLNSIESKVWPKRIFLARDNRRPYNQDELVNIAQKYGFEVIYPDRHSFSEQVCYFANADFIVGPLGAAWSNLIFSNTSCKCLSWLPEEKGEESEYSNIAGILGINLYYIYYKSGVKSIRGFYNHSYRLELTEFRIALESMLHS